MSSSMHFHSKQDRISPSIYPGPSLYPRPRYMRSFA